MEGAAISLGGLGVLGRRRASLRRAGGKRSTSVSSEDFAIWLILRRAKGWVQDAWFLACRERVELQAWLPLRERVS